MSCVLGWVMVAALLLATTFWMFATGLAAVQMIRREKDVDGFMVAIGMGLALGSLGLAFGASLAVERLACV